MYRQIDRRTDQQRSSMYITFMWGSLRLAPTSVENNLLSKDVHRKLTRGIVRYHIVNENSLTF